MQTTGTPRRRRLSVSQLESCPVSRPTRTAPGACWRTTAVIVSGSEQHFPRQMMAPASSMTQMEVCLERNVEADIMALLIHAFLRVALTLQSLPACLVSSRCPAITPCPVACDQVPGARGRGQGTETLAQLGGLPPSGACVSQRLDA